MKIPPKLVPVPLGRRTKLWLLERLACFGESTKAVYVAVLRRHPAGAAALRYEGQEVAGLGTATIDKPRAASVCASYHHPQAEIEAASGLASQPATFCYPLQSIPAMPHMVNLVSILSEYDRARVRRKVVVFDETQFRSSKVDKDKEKVRVWGTGWRISVYGVALKPACLPSPQRVSF